jgi:hypothetical protein
MAVNNNKCLHIAFAYLCNMASFRLLTSISTLVVTNPCTWEVFSNDWTTETTQVAFYSYAKE